MATLGVNVDHVATLRQARRAIEPDPVEAAALCEAAGCDAIVVHLREDRRHIQDADVERLVRSVRTRLNLEMSIVPEIVAIACRLRPHQATLVPERRAELTTEGGLDVVRSPSVVHDAVQRLRDAGVTVSLFVDPELEQVAAARAVGAEAVELHTGPYANAPTEAARRACLATLQAAAGAASADGLLVHAGHGLTYRNVRPVATLPHVVELNIGHAILARAVLVGLERAVRDMVALIREPR